MQMNRRKFLKMSVAAMSLPATLDLLSRAEAKQSPFYKVIYDARFPDSVAFAEESKRLGLAIYGIKGDITQLIHEDLYDKWQEEPITIAGLTREPIFDFLAHLSQRSGHRVLYSAEHEYQADGRLEHRISAAPGLLSEAKAAMESGSQWARNVAKVLTRLDNGHVLRKTARMSTKGRQSDFNPDQLVSFVIGQG